MGRHSAPRQAATALAIPPPPAAPTIFVEPVRRGRHAAAQPVLESPAAPVETPAVPVFVVEPMPPAPVLHHRHAAGPVHQENTGPGRDVLAWTGFAAVVAWAIIAADHDLSDATAWVLGVAALIPLALLTLAPARLRERRARRRDQ